MQLRQSTNLGYRGFFCEKLFAQQPYGSITVKPGQAFCPRIKIWFCCSKFESFFVRTSQIEIEKRTSRVKPRFE